MSKELVTEFVFLYYSPGGYGVGCLRQKAVEAKPRQKLRGIKGHGAFKEVWLIKLY